MARGPGRPKEFDHRVDTRLTALQVFYLRHMAGNESVANVIRRLVDQDLRRRLYEEVTRGR